MHNITVSARPLMEEDNDLWLSPISVWEAHLLAERNRIRLDPTPERWIFDALPSSRTASRLELRRAPPTLTRRRHTPR